MADTPKELALIPLVGVHGDTADRPRPVPRISNMRDSAAAATAPAKIADHDTALKAKEVAEALCELYGVSGAYAAAMAALVFMIDPHKVR